MSEENKKRPIVHHLKTQAARLGQGVKSLTKRVRSANKVEDGGRISDFPLLDHKLKHRLLATISYFHLLVFIPLLLAKKNEFVSFHARQGLALLVVWVIAPLAFWIPVVGWVALLVLVFEFIFGLTCALSGKKISLPLVHRLVVV